MSKIRYCYICHEDIEDPVYRQHKQDHLVFPCYPSCDLTGPHYFYCSAECSLQHYQTIAASLGKNLSTPR